MWPVPAPTDSGVTARLFGTFLTWLNDRTSDSYVICTCNDISKLPPEFSRSERFDGIWFLDLPGREQKDAIWDIYLKMFELDADQARPKDDQWTGAEVRACCRLAALLDLPLTAAAQNVVPVAVTAAESVERLRQWASGRCLDAEGGGIYRADGVGFVSKPGRRVRRGPVEQLTASIVLRARAREPAPRAAVLPISLGIFTYAYCHVSPFDPQMTPGPTPRYPRQGQPLAGWWTARRRLQRSCK